MRLLYDNRAKRILEQVLDPWGRVTLEFVVSAPDDQRFDLWFEPDQGTRASVPLFLRNLRRMSSRSCAIEVFSSTPHSPRLRACLRKQLNHQAAFDAKAQGKSRRLADALPFPLWIITPGLPVHYFRRRRVRRAPSWPNGFYFTDAETQLWFIVLSQLDRTPDTAVLRMLGPDRLCEQAIADIHAADLPEAERLALFELVTALRLAVVRDKNIPEAQKGPFTMTEAWQEVERIKQTARDEGRNEGLYEGLNKGRDEGLIKGREEQLRLSIEDLAEAYGVKLSLPQRRSLRTMKLDDLLSLRQHIKTHRSWPA
jgi:hypothetical protein